MLPHFSQTLGYPRTQGIAKYFKPLCVKFWHIKVNTIHMFLNHLYLTYQNIILKGPLRSQKIWEAHRRFLAPFMPKLRIENWGLCQIFESSCRMWFGKPNVAKCFQVPKVSTSCSPALISNTNSIIFCTNVEAPFSSGWLAPCANQDQLVTSFKITFCHKTSLMDDPNRENNIWSQMIRWQAGSIPFLHLGFWWSWVGLYSVGTMIVRTRFKWPSMPLRPSYALCFSF